MYEILPLPLTFLGLINIWYSLDLPPGIPLISPATVANSGLSISFDNPAPNSCGTPILVGIPKTSSANSLHPFNKEPPPSF